MAEDNLSMLVSAVIDDEPVQMTWHDGVLETEGFLTGKKSGSVAGYLTTLNEEFQNLSYEYNDTTYVTKMDTVYFLAWKTAVTFVEEDLIEDSVQSLYDLYINDYKDTLHWFINNHNAKFPDTIAVATEPSKRGANKGKYGITYLVSYEDKQRQKVNVGPAQIINTEMTFNRADKKNTASYSYRLRTWTDEYYSFPDSVAAVYTDSLFTIDDAAWTPSAVSNARKFDVLLLGKVRVKMTKTIKGEEKDPSDNTTEDPVFTTLSLSAWSSEDGTVELNGIKYKAKQ